MINHTTGYVSIGSNITPAYQLDVNGTVRAQGAITADSSITATGVINANGGIKTTGANLTTSVVNGAATASITTYAGNATTPSFSFTVPNGTYYVIFSLRSVSGHYTGTAAFDPRGPTFIQISSGFASTFTGGGSGSTLTFGSLASSPAYNFTCYRVADT
jgi:hypothetical protein